MIKKNWWYNGNRNTLETLSDEHILDFLQNYAGASCSFDEAVAQCSEERKEYLIALKDSLSLRDRSPIITPIKDSDVTQKHHNRLSYFHRGGRKNRRK